jgi:hypothetical protein
VTGVFAAQVEHKLEMTFSQLVEADEVKVGQVYILTKKSDSVRYRI